MLKSEIRRPIKIGGSINMLYQGRVK